MAPTSKPEAIQEALNVEEPSENSHLIPITLCPQFPLDVARYLDEL